MLKFNPIGEKVIIEEVDKSNMITEGGVYLPSSPKDKIFFTVKTVGNGKSVQENTEVGDSVVIKEYSGQDFDLLGQKGKVVDFSDILIIVKQEK